MNSTLNPLVKNMHARWMDEDLMHMWIDVILNPNKDGMMKGIQVDYPSFIFLLHIVIRWIW